MESSAIKNKINKLIYLFIEYNTEFIFVILIIISSIISDSFLTERNIFNLLRQISGLGILSMGMLLVILTGGIDLSVGSMLGLGGVLTANFLQVYSFSLPISILFAILMGVLLGSVSGYLVSIRGMAPFVATLAMMTIARGLAFIVSRGSPIIITNQILRGFGTNYFLKIPFPVFLMLGITITIGLLLKYTVFGRIVKAIGSNEIAVRLSGINKSFYKFSVYSISGGLAIIAGIISTSRTGVGSPLVGQAMELDAIAAVVIGGASLKGGKGTALKTILGVFILGVIGNIMNLRNVPAYPQQVIKGLIIIAAVLFQGFQSKVSKEEA